MAFALPSFECKEFCIAAGALCRVDGDCRTDADWHLEVDCGIGSFSHALQCCGEIRDTNRTCSDNFLFHARPLFKESLSRPSRPTTFVKSVVLRLCMLSFSLRSLC